eukprot:89721_1
MSTNKQNMNILLKSLDTIFRVQLEHYASSNNQNKFNQAATEHGFTISQLPLLYSAIQLWSNRKRSRNNFNQQCYNIMNQNKNKRRKLNHYNYTNANFVEGFDSHKNKKLYKSIHMANDRNGLSVNRPERLYAYKMPVDDGKAPNPWGGFLSLALCKPHIRLHAEKGDMVVATGSITGGQHGKLIWCGKITKKITFAEYYDDCKRNNIVEKFDKNTGDAIYFWNKKKRQMDRRCTNVHNSDAHQIHDLNGKYVLLSSMFWYFGKRAKEIPSYLEKIISTSRDREWKKQTKYLKKFEKWINKFPTGIHAQPNHARP